MSQHQVWYDLDRFDRFDTMDNINPDHVNALIERAWELGREGGYEAGLEAEQSHIEECAYADGWGAALDELAMRPDDIEVVKLILDRIYDGWTLQQATNDLPAKWAA